MVDTHNMSAKAATDAVSHITDRQKLLATRDREEAHPDRAGGRKQVIAAIDAQLMRLVPASEEGDWRENQWHGQPHFECTRCPFDTLHGPAMREHVKVHALPESPEPAEVVVVEAAADEPVVEVEDPSPPAGVADTNEPAQVED